MILPPRTVYRIVKKKYRHSYQDYFIVLLNDHDLNYVFVLYVFWNACKVQQTTLSHSRTAHVETSGIYLYGRDPAKTRFHHN